MNHIGDDPVSTERQALQTPEEARGLEEDLTSSSLPVPSSDKVATIGHNTDFIT